jgi:tetratricopeptide (TPR) repeat protein
LIVRPIVCRPFIGRREELAYLQERRREAASSRGGLVLVAGEAGVGKTRLINELRSSLAKSRVRVGVGQCLEFAQRPYGPVLDVLARFDPQAAELAPTTSKREQFDAIVHAFERAAARSALLAVIEDVHWADVATLELLTYLSGKLETMRMLVVASYRSEELHADHPTLPVLAKLARATRVGRVELAPLSGPDLRQFIDAALTGIDLPNETRRTVARSSEGNPFFTEELLKNAVERNVTNGAVADRTLPTTVRAALMERLRPLTDQERNVLAQAAIIGRRFDLDLLAATLGLSVEALLPTLQRAKDFQLVEEETATVFRFRHALTREAIYSGFLASQLRPLHRKIAVTLEALSPERRSIDSLAYHWWAAGDHARSARYNELAGDAAGRVHAHEDAIAFYQRALEASGIEPVARGAMVEKIADRRVALSWPEEANATYAEAADIFRDAGAHEREATCRVRVAITGYVLALSAPTAPLEEMLTRLDPTEYVARSRVHLGLAWLTATFWFPTRAAGHLALVDPRALTAAPDIGLRFHNVAAWVAMTLGDLEGFRREHAAWIEAAHAIGWVGAVAAAHYNGAMCYSFFGLHDEALEHIALALAVAREERSLHGAESALAISAMCYTMRGDLGRARAALEAVPATTENQINAGFGAAWGTVAGAYLGDEALIEKWFDGFEKVASPVVETACAAGFAEIMVRRGRRGDAAALLHRAILDCECPRGKVLALLAAGRYGAPSDR